MNVLLEWKLAFFNLPHGSTTEINDIQFRVSISNSHFANSPAEDGFQWHRRYLKPTESLQEKEEESRKQDPSISSGCSSFVSLKIPRRKHHGRFPSRRGIVYEDTWVVAYDTRVHSARIDRRHRSTGSGCAGDGPPRPTKPDAAPYSQRHSRGSRSGGWHSSFDLVLFVEDPSSWMVSITRKMPMYIVLLARRILNSHWTKTVTATTPIWPSIEAHL